MKRFTPLLLLSFLSPLIISCDSSSVPQAPERDDSAFKPQEISCSPRARLEQISANADLSLPANTASNVVDGQHFGTSKWIGGGDNREVFLTLREVSLLKGISIKWDNPDQRSYSFEVQTSQNNIDWLSVLTSTTSDPSDEHLQYHQLAESTARYVRILITGNSIDTTHGIYEIESFGCVDNKQSDIELDDWYLSIPVDETEYSKAKSIYEQKLNDDYFNHQFFFEDSQGGLVFRAPVSGAKTSTNTKYTRTELREMLRRGDTSTKIQGVNANNWVFSSAPAEDLALAGGIDGELYAELKVNHVTTSGEDWQVGRVIIGQIHANDDEPIRVYYRKLVQNELGAIYLAHETLGGDDVYYEVIGSRSQSAENPVNGIALGEVFAYRIEVIGNQLTFTLERENQEDLVQVIDMTESGYDQGGQYMYFKAGVYNQNNTGDDDDYVEASFLKIENSHF